MATLIEVCSSSSVHQLHPCILQWGVPEHGSTLSICQLGLNQTLHIPTPNWFLIWFKPSFNVLSIPSNFCLCKNLACVHLVT